MILVLSKSVKKEGRSGALSSYKKWRKKAVLQLMTAFLLIIMLAGGMGFLSGFLTGKCYERRNIQNLMEYYASLGGIDNDRMAEMDDGE